MKLFATDVFTPNDFPAYTYVQRAGDDLETKLRRALDTPKVVVLISGPSKSGRTVLVEKVVGKDNLIPVSGAEVESGEDLWSCVLSWIEAPTAITEQTTASTGIARITREIGNSSFVVFLDDFHYIPKDAQADVARQIKAAAERGIRICVATVPHRADDVVRSNHELRGRLAQVDTS